MPDERFKNIGEILAFAVEREEEAAHGYEDMMSRAKNDSLRLLLADLKAEEENHKRLLLDLSSSPAADLAAVKVPDLRISDFLVEAPVNAETSLQDLLIFAAKKEQKAVELYERLRAAASTDDQRRLFEFLISQERQHKLRLETEYENRILWEN
ncbi:MAG: ferritin family protein [Candidatus Aminicenantes bacterium]|nr:ferritin family protein [Candidatus Aminicenantes bacterium]